MRYAMLSQVSFEGMWPFSLVKPSALLENAIGSIANVTTSEHWLAELRSRSSALQRHDDFPVSTIRTCAAIETAIAGGSGALLDYYIWLASGCLTTAFIMTQRNSALRRIETSQNVPARSEWLASIRSGASFATVGFSHLTTSRRHLNQPPLVAQRHAGGWVLNGYCPWVTGGNFADWLVVGAVEIDGDGKPVGEEKLSELLFCLPKSSAGISAASSSALIALNASATGQIQFDQVMAMDAHVLHGPIENVMEASSRVVNAQGVAVGGAGAGGLQTSALAIGHAAQAIEYLAKESQVRKDLVPVSEGLHSQWLAAYSDLVAMDQGDQPLDSSGMRKRANDLALNSTQAALVAAKGLGFTSNHPVGRWCTEALFFLVWSCPQSVTQAHLCSFLT